MSADARRYVIAVAVMLAGAAGAQWVRTASGAPAVYHPDFHEVPMQIAGYQARPLPLDQTIFGYLGADSMVERLYTGSGEWVKLALIYGAQWRDVHSPVSCYPAQGWQIISDEQLVVPAPEDSPTPGPLLARLLRVKKHDEGRLALFAFCHPGGSTGNWVQQCRKVATGPRGAGGLIISLSTPLTPTPQAAQERLRQFLRQVYPAAVAFWYQGPPAEAAG